MAAACGSLRTFHSHGLSACGTGVKLPAINTSEFSSVGISGSIVKQCRDVRHRADAEQGDLAGMLANRLPKEFNRLKTISNSPRCGQKRQRDRLRNRWLLHWELAAAWKIPGKIGISFFRDRAQDAGELGASDRYRR